MRLLRLHNGHQQEAPHPPAIPLGEGRMSDVPENNVEEVRRSASPQNRASRDRRRGAQVSLGEHQKTLTVLGDFEETR